MQNFVNFLKENYSYFVYSIEFILAIVAAVIAFIQSLRFKNVRSDNNYLTEISKLAFTENQFFSCLPEWIKCANILYPCHGDGEKRFEFVYHKALELFGKEDPGKIIYSFVYGCVNAILDSDKFEKISRDTQVIEPKKEFYEKKENVAIERSQDLRQNGEENQSAECSARYVSRRD